MPAMWGRQTSGSVLCPGCGTLVGVRDEQCLTCGRRRPGLWGFAALLRSSGDDLGFLTLVMWACGALYLATLAVNLEGVGGSGLLGFLSPHPVSLFLFGGAGAYPVFQLGHWWALLSAGWLHGGLLHILFNMMAARTLIPAVATFYGPARTVILWVLASVVGFAASSAAGHYLTFMPRFLQGGQLTIGASASTFGLIGALAWYGRRGGSRLVAAHAREWALSGLLMGLLIPGIDNWAHLGGFAGGFLAGRWLDPLLPERGDHWLVALALLLACAAAVIASVVVGLPLVRGN
jgi:rhomboid protease GluP